MSMKNKYIVIYLKCLYADIKTLLYNIYIEQLIYCLCVLLL